MIDDRNHKPPYHGKKTLKDNPLSLNRIKELVRKLFKEKKDEPRKTGLAND